MWPCYSKFVWRSGDFTSSASPGQLCPRIIPHGLTVLFPLDVDSSPDLGPSSVFDKPPKDTSLAPVSSFIVLMLILVAAWVLDLHMIQDEHIALVFSVGIIIIIIIFFFASWESEALCNSFFPELFSPRVKAGSHLQLWPPQMLLPLNDLLPSVSPRPQKFSHLSFHMGSDHFLLFSFETCPSPS